MIDRDLKQQVEKALDLEPSVVVLITRSCCSTMCVVFVGYHSVRAAIGHLGRFAIYWAVGAGSFRSSCSDDECSGVLRETEGLATRPQGRTS